jgi:hypothetical protein
LFYNEISRYTNTQMKIVAEIIGCSVNYWRAIMATYAPYFSFPDKS